jgi:hypothetical protein
MLTVLSCALALLLQLEAHLLTFTPKPVNLEDVVARSAPPLRLRLRIQGSESFVPVFLLVWEGKATVVVLAAFVQLC